MKERDLMRITRIVSTSVVAIALAATSGFVSASDQPAKVDSVKAAPVAPEKSAPAQPAKADSAKAVPAASEKSTSAAVQLATLGGVKAVPMASNELDAVKGLHVHFLDGNGGFHLAGDVKHMNNWENIGGNDGQPVAPSYYGLCVAQGVGVGGIIIPGPNAVANECP
jgi:hypothetical protein